MQNTLFISFNSSGASIYNHNTGEVKLVKLNLLANIVANNTIITCNLNLLQILLPKHTSYKSALDILELYAFINPTLFSTNSIYGLAKALNLSLPTSLTEEAIALPTIISYLLNQLSSFNEEATADILNLTNFMLQSNNWAWSNIILAELTKNGINNNNEANPLTIIAKLEEIPAINKLYIAEEKELVNNITPLEVESKLNFFTSSYKKTRENQLEYALEAAKIFNPSKEVITLAANGEEENITPINVAFAEAGTGIGKTLGYLAGVLSFIEKNPKQTVLISTYSKALQKQILTELSTKLKGTDLINKIALIKGSNNYACLLKFEYLLNSINSYKNGALFIAIIAMWLTRTKSGDIEGGDIVPWLSSIINYALIDSLLYKRDECIYSKCPYYKKCFITKIKSKAKQANIIISNHALTLLNNFSPNYIIFDEAHNLYSVSDDVYSSSICGIRGSYLKSWIIGSNSKLRTNNASLNGIKARLLTLLKSDPKNKPDEASEAIDFKIKKLVDTLIFSAQILPDPIYLDRILSNSANTHFEKFLYHIYLHVLAHNNDLDQYYSQESIPNNFSDDFLDNIAQLKLAFNNMLKVSLSLKLELLAKAALLLDENKKSLEEFISTFEYNCINLLINFIAMLDELLVPNNKFIYRFMLNKDETNITNIGYFKNHINPMLPLANNVISNCAGITFTSATLIDPALPFSANNLTNKFGLQELAAVNVVSNIQIKSPFNYNQNSKVIILSTDYSKNTNFLSLAISQLFIASGGGALAIFTAINRMKSSYLPISKALQQNNLTLLKQHGGNGNSSSIIDTFKEEIHSCLLGTDSLRDGIDIPGESLRMVIFEKVPWPRKDILNSIRQKHLGKAFTNETVRFKLQQAFGRIIRTEDDKGVFVLLTPAIPSEFLTAFPESVEIYKIPLAEAQTVISSFLGKQVEK